MVSHCCYAIISSQFIWTSISPIWQRSEVFDTNTQLGSRKPRSTLTQHRPRKARHHLNTTPTPLLMNLHTLAGDADQTDLQPRKVLFLKSIGLYLGVPMAESNPRRVIKRSKENLGNTPLEVLTYLATYFEELFTNKTRSTPVHQTMSKS
jgi:hypothetical protein